MNESLAIYHLDGERMLRGTERQLMILADQLAKRGHRNVIVCRAGSPLDAQARSRGIERVHLPFLTKFDEALTDPAGAGDAAPLARDDVLGDASLTPPGIGTWGRRAADPAETARRAEAALEGITAYAPERTAEQFEEVYLDAAGKAEAAGA